MNDAPANTLRGYNVVQHCDKVIIWSRDMITSRQRYSNVGLFCVFLHKDAWLYIGILYK